MPLVIPCPQSIQDCECTLDPVSNYSSEEPDHQVFYGQFTQPPTVGSFFAPSCFGYCESTDSQQAADDCAERAAAECSYGGAPRAGNPLWSPSRRRFGNTLQECVAECGDGNSTTVVEPPGSVISYTQADADARAHGRACKRAQELLVCFVTASPLPQGNVSSFTSVPIVATGGNGDYEFTLTGGSLPPGITLDAVGLLLGTPTTAATYTFELTVADTGGGVATKSFTWVIADACGATTDWCTNPGACRVRIQNYNAADWVAGTFPPPFQSNPCDVDFFVGWTGEFATTNQIGGNPCLTYVGLSATDPSSSFLLDYDGGLGQWQLNFSGPGGTFFFANGPVDPSPLGVYTRDPDFSCTGPATLTLEPYSP